MCAHSLLRKCLRFEPQLIQEQIACIFDQSGSIDDWVTVHGLVLCLFVLCSKEALHNPFYAFVEVHGHLIQEASLSSIERLAKTALCALSSAIEVYGLYVTPVTIEETVRDIAGLVARPGVIAIQAIETHRAIIERFRPEHAVSPLPAMSDLMGYLHGMILSQSPSPDTIFMFYQMLESYLCLLPPSAIDIVRTSFATFHKFLQTHVDEKNPIHFTLRQCVIQGLRTLYREYPFRFPDIAPESADILLAIARRPNQRLIAEALEALVSTLSSLDKTHTVSFLSPI
jgi:hypothetical protein